MKSFISYIKENYGMPLFQQEVEEKPELLLESEDPPIWQVRQFFNDTWSKPVRAESLMDMLKYKKITVDWRVKKVGEHDMESAPIRLRKDLVGLMHKLKDIRNKNLMTMA